MRLISDTIKMRGNRLTLMASSLTQFRVVKANPLGRLQILMYFFELKVLFMLNLPKKGSLIR